MKKNLLSILLCLAVSITFTSKSSAQGTLLYYWNFNNFTLSYSLPNIASLAADYAKPGYDTAKARWIYKPKPGTSSAYSTYCDLVVGDVTNARLGAPAGNGFRARNPSDSMDILVYMPTTHYTNLTIKYVCELSSYSSGDSVNVFSYSVDSGTTWITSGAGLSEWVDSGTLIYSLITVHINDVTASNNPRFVFKINTLGRNSGSGGNNRFDNVTLEGDSVNLTLGVNQFNGTENTYSVYPNPVKEELNVNANTEGNKSILITNMLGQVVVSENRNSKNFSINTTGLSAGLYFIAVREDITGNVSTMKFVKQ